MVQFPCPGNAHESSPSFWSFQDKRSTPWGHQELSKSVKSRFASHAASSFTSSSHLQRRDVRATSDRAAPFGSPPKLIPRLGRFVAAAVAASSAASERFGRGRKWAESRLNESKLDLLKRLAPGPVRSALALLFILLSLTVWGILRAPTRASSLADDPAAAIPSLKAGLMWLYDEACRLRPANPPAPGQMRDFLVLLGSTAIGLPLMKMFGLGSKVLSFLAIGIVIGPSGFGLITDIHFSQTLAEAGIVFFLCEMGLELSFDRLQNMKRDVFGLGLAQFVFTTAVIALISSCVLGMNNVQACILGAAFSLSSSVFALQLLDETKERGTLHGRSAFGILLFQDLVVPLLLVLLPMLRFGSGTQLLHAIRSALVDFVLAVSPLVIGGRYLLGPIFSFVAEARNTVALRALSFFTVLGMCYIFQIFSLSNTLGAFLAGVLLSETAYHEQVDAAISPIREDLLGLFFVTVGFGIDLSLVLHRPFLVLSAMSGVLFCKAVVTTLVCRTSGLSFANSWHIGLLLCQAGEFSFVMLGIASEVGAFTKEQAKLLLTVTSVSMACTPFLSRLGRELSHALQEPGVRKVASNQQLREKAESARVFVLGYGRVGRLVTQLLDERFIPWVAFDIDSSIVNEARGSDLPVFEGECFEAIARACGPDKVSSLLDSPKKVAVVTMAHLKASLGVVSGLRQAYPNLTIISRALSKKYARQLEKEWAAIPIVPGLPEDTMMMNLPIGATVLRELGCSEADADAVIDDLRLEVLNREEKMKAKDGTKMGLDGLMKWYQGEQQLASQQEEAARGFLVDSNQEELESGNQTGDAFTE